MNQYHKLYYYIKSSHDLTKLRAAEGCISASQDRGNPEKAEREASAVEILLKQPLLAHS